MPFKVWPDLAYSHPCLQVCNKIKFSLHAWGEKKVMEIHFRCCTMHNKVVFSITILNPHSQTTTTKPVIEKGGKGWANLDDVRQGVHKSRWRRQRWWIIDEGEVDKDGVMHGGWWTKMGHAQWWWTVVGDREFWGEWEGCRDLLSGQERNFPRLVVPIARVGNVSRSSHLLN